MPQSKFPGLSPREWVSALELHLDFHFRKADITRKIHSSDIISWLRDEASVNVTTFTNQTISKLKARSTLPRPTSREGIVLSAIQRKLPVTAVLKHLANLRYRSLAFYDPQVPRDRTNELNGIYLARRYSFAAAKRVNVSAFRFRRDSRGRPFYKEKRIIRTRDKQYQVRTRGSWYLDRGGYSLIGLSYEFAIGAKEAHIKVGDLLQIYEDRLFLDNNQNPNVLRGIMPTIAKEPHCPSVTEIHLERLDVSARQEDTVWGNIENSSSIGPKSESIGVRVATQKELKELQLRPLDKDYRLPFIRTQLAPSQLGQE